MKAIVLKDVFLAAGHPLKAGVQELSPGDFQKLQGAAAAIEYDPQNEKQKKLLSDIEATAKSRAQVKAEMLARRTAAQPHIVPPHQVAETALHAGKVK